jgi:hypothetical protein
MAEEGWKLALTLEEITFFLKLYGWQFSLQLDG